MDNGNQHMTSDIVKITSNGKANGEIKIALASGAELSKNFKLIERAIYQCFSNRKYKIVIDMSNIKLPPTKLISLLIEASNQATRVGGYLKPINVSKTSENNLMSFNATSYLSIMESEEYALYDFDEELGRKFRERQNHIAVINKSNDIVTTDNASSRSLEQKEGNGDAREIMDMPSPIKVDKIRVSSQIDSLYKICDFVTSYAQEAGLDLKERGKIKVTVYEACLNVIEHAYFSNSENWIEVTVSYDKEKIFILIHDWGQGFEFDPHKEYDVELAVKNRKTGGFGLHIIRRSVDEIRYDTDPQEGNRLLLVKLLNDCDSK